MSNAIKKQVMILDDADASLSNTFLKTNKDKLVGLLLNEISFLDLCFYKTNVKEIKDQICLAIDIFENLLKLQRFTVDVLTDKDFSSLREFVYQTINQISKRILEVRTE